MSILYKLEKEDLSQDCRFLYRSLNNTFRENVRLIAKDAIAKFVFSEGCYCKVCFLRRMLLQSLCFAEDAIAKFVFCEGC